LNGLLIYQLERYEKQMSTEKRLIFVESKNILNIAEILSNNGVKILENEPITSPTSNSVYDFFANEIRQEYLLNYKWYQDPAEEKDPLYLEINEETYNKLG
jgi:hypothetical protein